MVRRNNIFANLDWISILIWLVMIAFGWMNIYSANIMEANDGVFDLSQRFGKQLLWIGASVVLGIFLLILDAKFYIYFSFILYFALVGILVGVLVFGTEINGAKSWFVIGGFQLQPSEFAKPITALALANLLTSHNYNLKRFWHLIQAAAIFLVPPFLILLQPDLGSTLVYFAFVFVLFREGFSANIMLMLVTLVFLFLATLMIDKALLLLLIVVAGIILYMIVSRSRKKGFIVGIWIAGIFGLLLVPITF
jgi:rod shape determining protein RodA